MNRSTAITSPPLPASAEPSRTDQSRGLPTWARLGLLRGQWPAVTGGDGPAGRDERDAAGVAVLARGVGPLQGAGERVGGRGFDSAADGGRRGDGGDQRDRRDARRQEHFSHVAEVFEPVSAPGDDRATTAHGRSLRNDDTARTS